MTHPACSLIEVRAAEATGMRPYTGCMVCGTVALLQRVCFARGWSRWCCAACAQAMEEEHRREGGKTTCSAAAGSGDGHIVRRTGGMT